MLITAVFTHSFKTKCHKYVTSIILSEMMSDLEVFCGKCNYEK